MDHEQQREQLKQVYSALLEGVTVLKLFIWRDLIPVDCESKPDFTWNVLEDYSATSNIAFYHLQCSSEGVMCFYIA